MTVKLIAPAGQGGIIMGASGVQYTIAADGTVTVNNADVLPLLRTGYGLFGLTSGKVSISSALPADLVSIVNAATPANGTVTIAAQPPHARKMQVRIVLGTPGTTNITAGTLTLVGTDQDGNGISEVIALNQFGAVSGTFTTKWAYAKLTSGTIAAYAANGSGTGNTVGIGLSNAFGVPTFQSGQGFGGVNLVCTKATKITKVLGTSNTAADDVAATTTVDTTARTITPTTVPAANGLVDYEFSYAFGGTS